MNILKSLILTVIAITNFSGLHSMEVGDASVPLLVEASVASDVQLTVVAGGETKSAAPGGEWPSLPGGAEVKVPSDKKELTDVFFAAIEAGSLETVQACLGAGARSDTHKKGTLFAIAEALNAVLNEKDEAKKEVRLQIIKAIHAQGQCKLNIGFHSAEFTQNDSKGNPTPIQFVFLHWAAKHGDPKVLTFLIDEKICDVDMKSPGRRSALFFIKSLDCAKVLLGYRGNERTGPRININAKSDAGAYAEDYIAYDDIINLIEKDDRFQLRPYKYTRKIVTWKPDGNYSIQQVSDFNYHSELSIQTGCCLVC